MAKKNERLVVVMLESKLPGEEFEIWPPHITIVPWFPCDDSRRLGTVLSEVARRHRPLEVSSGEVEVWGGKDKFEVLKIEDEGALLELHQDVFNSLENNGFSIHQKDYLGDKYTPHVTLRNHESENFRPAAGTALIINRFALIRQVRLKKSGRMIKSLVREYELG
ncbi:MAG TPA: 2'-5' RNA ligase family protein [Candidatus Saccharimonadales bacterium]|nr:2'-5' RNA ligase family protein [Candidatus Saccharimonadales bacterium]